MPRSVHKWSLPTSRNNNQSKTYRSKHICIAPYVANESEAHNNNRLCIFDSIFKLTRDYIDRVNAMRGPSSLAMMIIIITIAIIMLYEYCFFTLFATVNTRTANKKSSTTFMRQMNLLPSCTCNVCIEVSRRLTGIDLALHRSRYTLIDRLLQQANTKYPTHKNTRKHQIETISLNYCI